MFLVIPSIELRGSYCVRKKKDSFERESIFFDDPVKMARLWRLQNARTLHIEGHDAGNRCRRNVLKDICSAIDIPVQLRGGLRSLKEIKSAFDVGVYRIVVEVNDSASITLFQKATTLYSCSRVIAGISTASSAISADGPVTLESAVPDIVKKLESSGCRRFIFSDNSFNDTADSSSTDHIRSFCGFLQNAHVTVTDCISEFKDLMSIADLQTMGVDSAIIGRPLYENCFPCQQSWCWNHIEDLDLSRVSTAQLRN